MSESGRLSWPKPGADPLKYPQIGGNLTRAEAADFAAYAAMFQLRLNQLGFLLVIRELNIGRLSDLAQTYGSKVPKAQRKRVTTRPKDIAIKNAFVAHAAKHHMGSDEGASLIFRAELTERWLAVCIGADGESALIPQLS